MIKNELIIGLLVLLFLTLSNHVSGQNLDQVQVYGNSHYSIDVLSSSIYIEFEKEAWESFTIQVPTDQLPETGVLELEFMATNGSSIQYTLMTDEHELQTISSSIFFDQFTKSEILEIPFDRSSAISAEYLNVLVYINPGQKSSGYFELFKVRSISSLINEEIIANFDLELAIYPNPVRDLLSIQSNSTAPYHLSIYNDMGSLVLQQMDLSELDSRIDVQFLTSGRFIIELQNGETVKRLPFIKID